MYASLLSRAHCGAQCLSMDDNEFSAGDGAALDACVRNLRQYCTEFSYVYGSSPVASKPRWRPVTASVRRANSSAASSLVRTPSFLYAFARWVSTVRTDTDRRLAIFEAVAAVLNSWRTSTSLGVKLGEELARRRGVRDELVLEPLAFRDVLHDAQTVDGAPISSRIIEAVTFPKTTPPRLGDKSRLGLDSSGGPVRSCLTSSTSCPGPRRR